MIIKNQDKKGLRNRVESIIKTIAPKLAEKKKHCKGCKKRKHWLNNINAKFS